MESRPTDPLHPYFQDVDHYNEEVASGRLWETLNKHKKHLEKANETKRMHRLWEEAYLKFFVAARAASNPVDFDMDRISSECEDLADTAVAAIKRRSDAREGT